MDRRLLAREWLVVVAVAAYAVVVLVALPQELVQDAWLTLVGGREVARHGLPATDHLTVWTAGARWIDQQWLAQLGFYGLTVLGGIRLALLGHATLLVAGVASAVVAARRRGASQKSVFLVAGVCTLMAPWALQLRAQSVAELLFVWLLWALVSDSRSPSWRVAVVLPLLALWANVHGTVVMGVALCLLRAVTILFARGEPHRRARAALLLATPATLVASPYGLELLGYYRRLLLSPALHRFVEEWGPSTPSQKTAIFFVVAAATIWVVARYGSRLTPFERLALLCSLASALVAIRSIVWFALAALVILPYALDGGLTRPAHRPRPFVASAALGAVVLATAFAASRPAGWYTREWPSEAAHAIGRAADRDGSLLVMADDRYADWLLWEEPGLAGRVAYDVRFELFSDEQLARLFAYRNRVGDGWRRAGRSYGLVALDRTAQQEVADALLREPDARLVYRDARIDVVLRPAAGAGRALAAR